jgi:hypothetical protein
LSWNEEMIGAQVSAYEALAQREFAAAGLEI